VRLSDITPVILTYNEEPNIRRVLAKLSWARHIVIVDSHSTDKTREIISEFQNAQIFPHTFEAHAAQWKYAIRETGIATEWILALDSDYVLSDELVEEMANLTPADNVAGYEAAFRYLIQGHALARSIYPPRIVLCRRDRARIYQDGHTQRLEVTGGDVRRLKSLVDHDDRKSLTRWIAAQDRYAQLERQKLFSISHTDLRIADRLRARGFFAPVAVLLHCLFIKGLIFNGLHGLYYSYQRAVAEFLLSLYLIDDRLKRRKPPD
jgi:glycosyltransferase involved in cell wall biosynthesis